MQSFFLVILTLIIPFFMPLSAFAEEQNTQTVVLPKNETINHNYFATGSSVDIEGTVNGDVYAAGGNVLINGIINGDVIAVGGQVTVRGTAQNVRVAGGQLVIDGKVNGNITTLGGNITTTDASRISGSLVGAGGQFNLLGPIDKTVSLTAGQISLGNTIGSDVWLNGENITFTPQAKVNGNVSYVSSHNAQVANGTTITGEINHTYPTPSQRENERQRSVSEGAFAALTGLGIAFSIASFLVSLVVGLLLLSFAPVYVERVMEHITRHPWQSLLIGIITWILTPIVVIVLLITVIGIPFAVVAGIGVGIFSYIGKILVATVIGQWTVARFDKRKNMAVALLVGLIVVEVISIIPFLGWLFSLVVAAVGFGSVLFMERVYYAELRAKKVI